MKQKLGVITIGQSPRDDVVPEMKEFLGENVEIIQSGALDGLEREEIEEFKPEEGDYVLISKLRDGSSVKFSEGHILPRLQDCIDKLEDKGVDIILFICTEVFPDIFKSTVPVLYPQKIIHGVVPNLLDKGKLAIITPDKDQIKQSQEKWGEIVSNVEVVSASPYTEVDEFPEAIDILRDSDASIVVMDCMGYTGKMKERVVKETDKMVVLSRTIVARILGEILNS